MDELTLFFIKIFKYKQQGDAITEDLAETLLKEAIKETAMQRYTNIIGA